MSPKKFSCLAVYLATVTPTQNSGWVAAVISTPAFWLSVGLALGVILAVWRSTKLRPEKFKPPISGEELTERKKKDLLEKLTRYIEGKVKRYWLLFAVNGGAFLIAKFVDENTSGFVGQLSPIGVAMGGLVFGLVMTVDIWSWGWQMRRPEFAGEHAFTKQGRAIALLIGGLTMSGWILAAMPPPKC